MPAPDVALLSLGTTPGLRRADAAFAEQLREAGVDCRLVPVEIGRAARALRRNPAVTDFVEALAARRTLRPDARVTVYSTVTAAFFQPRADGYAVRFDSPAALNRPGSRGPGSDTRSGAPWRAPAACCPGARAPDRLPPVMRRASCCLCPSPSLRAAVRATSTCSRTRAIRTSAASTCSAARGRSRAGRPGSWWPGSSASERSAGWSAAVSARPRTSIGRGCSHARTGSRPPGARGCS